MYFVSQIDNSGNISIDAFCPYPIRNTYVTFYNLPSALLFIIYLESNNNNPHLIPHRIVSNLTGTFV